MAVVKVFDALGVKTLVLMGNANDQPYDELEEESSLEYAEPTGDDEE